MQKPCCDCAACQPSCRVVRVLSSAMRCAFAAVVATAALYEALRSTLLFPWLDEEVGGVGGVGGLTNMRGPHANCSTTAGGASAPYCFHPGLVLGFTPFALVLLSVWVLPLAVGAAAAARTTVIARPSQVQGGPRRAAAAVGAFLRQRSTGGVHLAGHPPIDTVHPRAVTAFLAINTLWFVLPLAQYALLDPFFRRSVWHVSLAVSLAAAYPLSWHLSLVALPSAGARFLPPLLGLSKEQLLSAHKLDAQMRKTCSLSRQSPRPGVRGPVKFTQLHSPRPSPRPRSFATGRLAARATVFWAALHAAGQVSYLLATGTLRARLSASAGEAPSPPQSSPHLLPLRSPPPPCSFRLRRRPPSPSSPLPLARPLRAGFALRLWRGHRPAAPLPRRRRRRPPPPRHQAALPLASWCSRVPRPPRRRGALVALRPPALPRSGCGRDRRRRGRAAASQRAAQCNSRIIPRWPAGAHHRGASQRRGAGGRRGAGRRPRRICRGACLRLGLASARHGPRARRHLHCFCLPSPGRRRQRCRSAHGCLGGRGPVVA